MALKVAVAGFFGIALASKVPYLTQHGPPWVPTETRNFALLERFLEENNNVKRRKFLDLGSGDGKLLLWAAKRFDISFGIEISPIFYYVAKLRCAGVQNIQTSKQDFFDYHFDDSDFIYCFGVDFIMGRLLQKCQAEMNEDAIVCTYGFGFPGVRPYLLMHGSKDPYRPDMPIDRFPDALMFYRKQDLFDKFDKENLKFNRI